VVGRKAEGRLKEGCDTIMKILEAQSAVLTNYEVYTHLSELRQRYAKERKNKRGKDRNRSNPDTGTTQSIFLHQSVQPRPFMFSLPGLLTSFPGPGNLQTIVMELMDYFEKPPSPLGSKPMPYNENTIRTLLERLRPYDLTKAEIIMIMNNRPTVPAVLQTLIEEFDDRFYDDVDGAREDILNIIAEVLGTPGHHERAAMAQEAIGRREKDKETEQAANDDVQMEEEA